MILRLPSKLQTQIENPSQSLDPSMSLNPSQSFNPSQSLDQSRNVNLYQDLDPSRGSEKSSTGNAGTLRENGEPMFSSLPMNLTTHLVKLFLSSIY